MTVSLEDRGKALEDEFFHKENARKLDELKQKLDNQRTKDELRKASGMTDDAVLDKLVDLGINGQTMAALALVPLITVAWADGSIQDKERDAILQAAHDKNLDKGSPAYGLLEAWLTKKPAAGLFDAWHSYVSALTGLLSDEQNRKLKKDIMANVTAIAESAGGLLGFGTVSGSERSAIDKIAASFDA